MHSPSLSSALPEQKPSTLDLPNKVHNGGQRNEEADRLVTAVEPGTLIRGDDSSYIAVRRLLLYRKALAGNLSRQGWQCNGNGYNTYRHFIHSLKQWDSAQPVTPRSETVNSTPWDSPRRESPLDYYASSEISIKTNNSSLRSSPAHQKSITNGNEPPYSFVGMHCLFDDCKASVNVIKFAHLSLDLLAYAATNGTLTICSVSEPPHILQNLEGHTKEVTDVDWSCNNQYICSSSMDKSVRVWDAHKGTCIRVVYDNSPQTCIRFNPVNNNFLIVGSANKAVRVINFSTGRCLHKISLERNITAMDVEPSGRITFAGDSQGCVHSFKVDLQTAKISRMHKNHVGLSRKSETTTVQFRSFSNLAGGPVLLVANQDGSLRFFSVALKVDGYLTLRCSLHLSPHARKIRASFCPLLSLEKGEFIVSGHEDSNVYFYDFTRPKHPCVNKLQGHRVPVVGVSWNYGEDLLASSDCEGLVIVWKRTRR